MFGVGAAVAEGVAFVDAEARESFAGYDVRPYGRPDTMRQVGFAFRVEKAMGAIFTEFHKKKRRWAGSLPRPSPSRHVRTMKRRRGSRRPPNGPDRLLRCLGGSQPDDRARILVHTSRLAISDGAEGSAEAL